MGLYYTFFVIPVILPFYFWDKARQERIIAAERRELGHCEAGRAHQWSPARALSTWA